MTPVNKGAFEMPNTIHCNSYSGLFITNPQEQTCLSLRCIKYMLINKFSLHPLFLEVILGSVSQCCLLLASLLVVFSAPVSSLIRAVHTHKYICVRVAHVL